VNIFDSHNKQINKSDGNIAFYGAYFRFEDILKDQVPTAVSFYNRVVRLS